jgi:hypothetical protein
MLSKQSKHIFLYRDRGKCHCPSSASDFFSTGISEAVPRLFATGSSCASTWKPSHHPPPYH